ncbi:MAG TPA: hypothetical protein VL691_05070 [Vicinamibacteria bacterium]|nr:hypothetical protein [Vicinamibacteria bacterium]
MLTVIPNPLVHPAVLLPLSLVLLWLSTHLGAWIERRWRPLKEEERETFQVISGAALTLLGLIIAFSFSMAVGRYDQRKNLEEAEANAIGTEFLRVELMPAAVSEKAKELLRTYVDRRILFYEERHEGRLGRIADDTARLQGELWSMVRTAAAAQPDPVMAVIVSGMNDVLNSQGYTQAAWWNRIPEGAWILMVAIAMSCCALVGYSAHEVRPSVLVILPAILSIAFFFIADIDSPRHGLIRVMPHNLISLAQSLR